MNDADDDAKISNEETASVLTLAGLIISVQIYILNFSRPNARDELLNLTLVSKQIYKDRKRPGIERKIVPTIEIRSRDKSTE